MRSLNFIALLLVSFSALFAGANGDFISMDFSRENNLGIKKTDRIQIYSNRVQVGKVDLKSPQALNTARLIQDYKSKTSKQKCAAGTFELAKDIAGKKSSQKGCAEGAAYRELFENLQLLLKLAQKESAHGS